MNKLTIDYDLKLTTSSDELKKCLINNENIIKNNIKISTDLWKQRKTMNEKENTIKKNEEEIKNKKNDLEKSNKLSNNSFITCDEKLKQISNELKTCQTNYLKTKENNTIFSPDLFKKGEKTNITKKHNVSDTRWKTCP